MRVRANFHTFHHRICVRSTRYPPGKIVAIACHVLVTENMEGHALARIDHGVVLVRAIRVQIRQLGHVCERAVDFYIVGV